MLFNLMGNACKFTFRGYIKVRLTYEDNHLITCVNDTGIGIQAEDLRKLFKFFGKLQDTNGLNKGGIGMGLTISKMIV